MLRLVENITKRKDGRYMGRFIVGYDNKGKALYLRGEINKLTTALERSNKRVSELEGSDVYKSIKVLENASDNLERANAGLVSTNARLEKQVADMMIALEKIPDLQSKIETITNENLKLEKSVLLSEQTLDNQKQIFKLKEEQLRNELNSSEKMKRELLLQLDDMKDRLLKTNSQLERSIQALETETRDFKTKEEQLQKQIDFYEQSRSWKITKPFRSIACFFRRLFGKAKQ